MGAFGKIFSKKRNRFTNVWSFNNDSTLLTSSVVISGQNGKPDKIVFGTKTGNIFLLNDTGDIEWRFRPEIDVSPEEEMFFDEERINSISSKPGILKNDDDSFKIIFGTETGSIYCLDHDSSLRWKIKTKGPIRSSPVIGDINDDGENEIIVGSGEGLIYCISNEGNILSTFTSPSPIDSTPLLVNNMIIVGTTSGSLIAFNKDGSIKWKYKTDDHISARPKRFVTSSGDEGILVCSHDGTITMLTYDGEKVWSFETQGAIVSEPAIGDVDGDGKNEICLGSCDNNMYCLNEHGEKKWAFETDFWIIATPEITDIDGDGKVEVITGSLDHKLYILDGSGAYKLNYVPGVSGIVNQQGQSSAFSNKDIQTIEGSKRFEFESEDSIVGHTLIKGTKKIIINTKNKGVHSIEFK